MWYQRPSGCSTHGVGVVAQRACRTDQRSREEAADLAGQAGRGKKGDSRLLTVGRRSQLCHYLGCNAAWGLVDAVMYLLAVMAERGRNLAVMKQVQSRSNPARARALILDVLPPVIASTMETAEVDMIRHRLERLPVPSSAGLTTSDFRGALGVFLLVFLATLPVALPFAFIDSAHRALRVSNGIALLMLFAGGYYLGRHAGRHPWWSGLAMLTIGAGLALATIALGG